MCVQSPRIGNDLPAVTQQQDEKHHQENAGDEIKPRLPKRRKIEISGVDADMSPFQKCVGESKAHRYRKTVARQFIRAGGRHRKCFADENLEGNEKRGRKENDAACPRAIKARLPREPEKRIQNSFAKKAQRSAHVSLALP
jgi:hypothetical protein